MKEKVIQSYQRGSLAGSKIRSNVEDIWLNLRSDPRAFEELRCLGISVEQLPLTDGSPFVIEEQGQGLTAAEVLITIGVHALSAGSYDILKQVWLRLIAPKLKMRVDDALGPPTDGTT